MLSIWLALLPLLSCLYGEKPSYITLLLFITSFLEKIVTCHLFKSVWSLKWFICRDLKDHGINCYMISLIIIYITSFKKQAIAGYFDIYFEKNCHNKVSIS